MTTLYKLSNTALLSWSITVENKIVLIEHGQFAGKKQIDKHECGSIALAFEEMERRIADKLHHQGYSYDEPMQTPRLPMLVQSFAPHKLVDNLSLQPKLDGIRCLATSSLMISRRGERINSMPHINNALTLLPPGIKLDGEIYKHGESFQEHLSFIKRDTAILGHQSYDYHVFDIVVEGIPFVQRHKQLKEIITDVYGAHGPVRLVPTIPILKRDIAVVAHRHYGMYEGVVLRNPHGLYEYNTRSYDVQKYKFTNTDECQITDIVASTTGREANAAIFVCVLNGRSFKVRPKMSLYVRKGIYEQKSSFIGRWTRVTYEGLSAAGKPLKPRAEGLEDFKEDLQ